MASDIIEILKKNVCPAPHGNQTSVPRFHACSPVCIERGIMKVWLVQYTVCPTRYRTRHFFNNSNTNEDIATKFEQEYVRCVRNEKKCVCSVCL